MRTGSGKCIAVMVQPSDTITRIKAKIKEEEKLALDEQFILSFDGKLLDNGRTVRSYNIQNGSTLFGTSGIYHRAKNFCWIKISPNPAALHYANY